MRCWGGEQKVLRWQPGTNGSAYSIVCVLETAAPSESRVDMVSKVGQENQGNRKRI